MAYDRLLALRFGAAAVELLAREQFGCMVALDPPDVKAVPLAEALDHLKYVPLDGDVIRTARAVGICLGRLTPTAVVTTGGSSGASALGTQRYACVTRPRFSEWIP